MLNEQKIYSLINQYKGFASYINENIMNELINKIMNILLSSSYFNNIKDLNINDFINSINKIEFYNIKQNKYKDLEEIFYYNDCEFVDEETIKLIDIKCFNKNLYKNQFYFILGDKKIIIKINSNLINIGYLNDNIFNTEMIIKIKENSNTNIIIDKIKSLNFSGFKTVLLFNDNNLSDFNDSEFIVYNLSKEKTDSFLKKKSSQISKNEQINDSKQIIISNPNNENKNSKEENQAIHQNMNHGLGKNKNKVYTINEELKNLILLYIDYEDLKKKMKNSLSVNNNNDNISNYYYLLNYEWIKKYINLNNMDNIFNYIINNNIIEKIINYELLPIDEKISEIIKLININDINNIKKSENYINSLKDFNLLNIKHKLIQENSKKSFYYFYDFLILKEERFRSFTKSLNISNKNELFCMFGDEKIFIYQNYENSFIIEIGTINNNLEFIIEYFFDYNSKDILDNNWISLINIGFNEYISKLLFCSQNNYVSPIFDENQKIIGNAIKFDEKIIEYNDYCINEFLYNLVKFHLYDAQLRLLINCKNFEFKQYYLINEKWIYKFKDYYKYDNIANLLQKDEIINNVKYNDKVLFSGKNIISLIKSLPIEINIELNKKEKEKINKYVNNNQIEPNVKSYNYENDNYLKYYDNFQIISEEMYNLIFEDDKHSILNQHKNNYVKCIFHDKIIMIELSKFMNEINKYILEVGYIEKKNYKFVPLYILIYKDKKDFLDHTFYFINNKGIINFFKSIDFKQTNNSSLFDYSHNREIGKIYNLQFKSKNPNNNNNNKNENRNIIKNNDNGYLMLNKYGNFVIDFPFPQLIGLQNVGATCYMNATLQCFCQIKQLVIYFKYNPDLLQIIQNYKNKNESSLTYSFKNLIENLWPSVYELIDYKNNFKNSNNKYFAPYEFKEKISKMNPLFKGVQANDSKDLVNFIIMTLHQELNKAPKKELPNNNQIVDQTNKQLIYQYFINNYQNENKSIVSDIFYGINFTSTQCSNCKIIKYNFQTYFFLIFPLEEVRKMKIQLLTNQFEQMYYNIKMMNPFLYQQYFANFKLNINNMKSVNIIDCFQYNQKMEYFTGENSMYCNKCNVQCSAYYQTKLFSAPQILIIVLNRGKGIEFIVKLEFFEDLNLANFIENKNAGFMYKLIGVVTHLGESGASGHFIAYCRSPIDNQWYRYNDDLVSKVNNFYEEIINYAMPYILFFQNIQLRKN